MGNASISRMNLWLVMALVVAVALIVAVMFVMVQPILSHWIGGTLQGPQPMAPVCPGSPVGC